MCLGLKTEPAQWWRGDVQDGTGAGGAQCRARTLAPAHTGSALCPLVCPETWSAPDSSPAVPRPFLPPAAWQRGPTRPSGSLYHYSAHRPFTPSTPGQPLPSEFWGRNFPFLLSKSSKTNSLVKNGSVYTFGKNSPMEAFNKAYHLLLPHFIWEWWIKRMIP